MAYGMMRTTALGKARKAGWSGVESRVGREVEPRGEQGVSSGGWGAGGVRSGAGSGDGEIGVGNRMGSGCEIGVVSEERCGEIGGWGAGSGDGEIGVGANARVVDEALVDPLLEDGEVRG